MKMPNEMAPWKRALAFLGFAAGTFFIVFSVVHSMSIDCAPESGVYYCVHREKRAWVTTDETRFGAPPADRVNVRKWGKHNGRGDLEITTDTGGEVEISWLNADEAQTHAAALVTETAAGRPYHLITHGPRWWLLLLLFTVPVMVSLVLPQRLHAPTAELLASVRVPPVVLDKKLKRAERKARERAAREK